MVQVIELEHAVAALADLLTREWPTWREEMGEVIAEDEEVAADDSALAVMAACSLVSMQAAGVPHNLPEADA